MSRPLLLWLLPLLLSLLSHNAVADTIYQIHRSKSVKGYDINCNKLDSQGKPATYCYECGGVAAVAAKCDNHPDCVGFDMQDYSCGYLKTKTGPSVRQGQPGFASFCDEELGKDCFSDWAVYIDYEAAPGLDYDCNYQEEGKVQSFCKRAGDPIALMDECDRNAGGYCNGFVVSIESNGQYGYLKRIPPGTKTNVFKERRARKGFMFFVKTIDNRAGRRRSLQQLGA